ncbi:restriction endonuclease subunit S [Acinetobacter haemolyticus]|uniref:restriction endonuclease subunit S n=1 Tax=Acinetobacter haemolyticus TaxID=29430 RepID=UPI00030FAB57|nr:restriction endonuclease subunit S [Acinetobacter haemolyticus]
MEKQKCPEIRFQQFNDTWTETSLGNLSQIRRGASPRPIEDPKWFDKSGLFGWLRIADVTQQNGRIFSIEQKLSVQGQQKTLILEEPHLILSIAATVGKPVINYVPTGIHDGFIVFLNLNADREFIFQWLERFRLNWFKLGQPGSQLNLNSELVKNQGIFLSPLMEEQTQIGNFFQNLDQSIALHEKKLTQTQNLKKAMLEKMFPKVGSTQPEIRLKGFSGDWVNSQLSNFISIKHGFAFDGAYFSEIETNLCLLTPGNFMIGGGFKAEKFIYYNGEVPENYILQENDLLVTMTDLSKESDTLGLPALLPLIRGKTLLHNQRLGLISFDNDELDKGFLFYLLQTESYHKYIVLSATGTTVKHTSPSKILAFVCDVPEFEEQKAIGQFFKQLDKTLVLQQQQLQTLKNLKQAFLEKMFV